MADVAIENSSAATKRAIRDLSLGAKTFTVGANGDYATLGEAWAAISQLPAWTAKTKGLPSATLDMSPGDASFITSAGIDSGSEFKALDVGDIENQSASVVKVNDGTRDIYFPVISGQTSVRKFEIDGVWLEAAAISAYNYTAHTPIFYKILMLEDVSATADSQYLTADGLTGGGVTSCNIIIDFDYHSFDTKIIFDILCGDLYLMNMVTRPGSNFGFDNDAPSTLRAVNPYRLFVHNCNIRGEGDSNALFAAKNGATYVTDSQLRSGKGCVAGSARRLIVENTTLGFHTPPGVGSGGSVSLLGCAASSRVAAGVNCTGWDSGITVLNNVVFDIEMANENISAAVTAIAHGADGYYIADGHRAENNTIILNNVSINVRKTGIFDSGTGVDLTGISVTEQKDLDLVLNGFDIQIANTLSFDADARAIYLAGDYSGGTVAHYYVTVNNMSVPSDLASEMPYSPDDAMVTLRMPKKCDGVHASAGAPAANDMFPWQASTFHITMSGNTTVSSRPFWTPKGHVLTFICEQGASAQTIAFGTGYTSTGLVNGGATGSAQRSIIEFISNGDSTYTLARTNEWI